MNIHTRTSRLLSIGLHVTIGMLLSVAIAASITVLGPLGSPTIAKAPAWLVTPPDTWPAAEHEIRASGLGIEIARASTYQLQRPNSSVSGSTPPVIDYYMERTRSGLPLACFEAFEISSGKTPGSRVVSSSSLETGLEMPRVTNRQGIRPVRMPVWPISLGLILDSLFWGFVSWSGLTAIRILAARRRRSRNRCSCGYQLLAGQSKCPECGQASYEQNGVPAANP